MDIFNNYLYLYILAGLFVVIVVCLKLRNNKNIYPTNTNDIIQTSDISKITIVEETTLTKINRLLDDAVNADNQGNKDIAINHINTAIDLEVHRTEKARLRIIYRHYSAIQNNSSLSEIIALFPTLHGTPYLNASLSKSIFINKKKQLEDIYDVSHLKTHYHTNPESLKIEELMEQIAKEASEKDAAKLQSIEVSEKDFFEAFGNILDTTKPS